MPSSWSNYIADRTYHRLLHVDWIQADINGDGVPNGAALVPPSRSWSGAAAQLLAVFDTAGRSPTATTQTSDKTGSTSVGTIYSDRASVPSRFKSNFTQGHPGLAVVIGEHFSFHVVADCS